MATLALIRRAIVDDHRWISPEDFARYWALVLMVPGINLLGLIILVGNKIGGAKGVCLALFGLLFPSVTITILLTAAYAKVEHAHLIVSALSGVIPATVGIGIFTGGQIAWPVLKDSWKRGLSPAIVAGSLFIGSGIAEGFSHHLPVVVILLSCAVLGALSRLPLISQRADVN